MKVQWFALFAVFAISTSILFANPYAEAAGVIEGEFKLGEVLDESIGWFIVVGLGMVFAGIISAEIKIEEKYLGHVQNSEWFNTCLLYTSPSPRDGLLSRMPSSA